MINTQDKLIKSEIKGRQVTYYLTTEEDLQNVKNNSLLGDIFSVLASMSCGGIISVILTRATGVQLEHDTMNLINILLFVFIIGAIIFSLFCAYFHIKSFGTINKIKGSGSIKSIKSPIQEEEIEVVKSKKDIIPKKINLEIIKAEYWTKNARLDVTKELRDMIVDNKLETIASNDIKRDPDIGTVKKLTITYKYNNITITKEFTEDDKVLIP